MPSPIGPPAIHLQPLSYLLKFRAKIVGGCETKTEPVSSTPGKKGALEEVTQTTRKVESAAEYKNASDFTTRVVGAVEGLVQPGPAGWLLDTNARPQVDAKIAELTKEAVKLNKTLKTCSVVIEHVFMNLEVKITPSILKLVADGVRQNLIALRDALRTPDLKDAQSAFTAVRGDALMVMGVQADAINYALEQAKTLIKARTPARPDEPLTAFDNAISYFTNVDAAQIPEL